MMNVSYLFRIALGFALVSSLPADESEVGSPQQESGQEKATKQVPAPTREQAVKLLGEMKAATKRADKDRLAELFHRPPEIDPKLFRKGMRGFIEMRHTGDGPIDLRKLDLSDVDQLMKEGSWGPAAQMPDQDHVRRVIAQHEVDLKFCFFFSVKKSETKAIVHHHDGNLVILDYRNARFKKIIEESVEDSLGVIAKGDPTGSAMSFGMLAWLGPKAESAIPALKKLLESDDPEVRSSAAVTLWKIDRNAKESIPPIVGVLGNEKASKWERIHAATYLGEIGPAAKAALPALKAAKDAGDVELKAACEKAIEKIAHDHE